MIETPAPTDVPEVHEPEYHFQVEPVPSEPPVNVNTDVLFGHITSGVDSADVADVETVLIVTLVVTHVVLLQVPSALT